MAMKVMITGGCGFIGQRLALRLLEKGELSGPDGPAEIEQIILADVATSLKIHPGLVDNVEVVKLDVCDVSMDPTLPKTDVIFHLSSVLSGEGETNFDKAMRVNLDGTKGLLEAMRVNGLVQRLVFTSTTAVFGHLQDKNAPVGDFTKHAPLTTYGTTKSIGELLVNEYSRKGFVDGRSVRLPTVIVREGSPNSAASSFCSDVIREPLKGRDTVLPVPRGQAMPLTSYRAAVDGLIALCEMDATKLEGDLVVGLPALNVTAGDLVDCTMRLRNKREGMGNVEEKIDPAVAGICAGWPAAVDNGRSKLLGLPEPGNLDEIVQDYIDDYIDLA